MLIIPAIDMRGGRCVRLFQGDYARETVYGDNPAEQAVKWMNDGAEIIHLVDLDGAKAGHPVNVEPIRRICESVNIPCEIGGGIRTEQDAELLFNAGVSRVILGTVACENPEIAKRFIEKFGPEKVVVGIDAKDGKVAVRGWIETSKVDALELAVKMTELGVKRIIFTDIATDGAFTGPSLKPTAALCRLVPDCKIIASGVVSAAEDAAKLSALKLPNLEGVIVGKALYDGRTTYRELVEAAARG